MIDQDLLARLVDGFPAEPDAAARDRLLAGHDDALREWLAQMRTDHLLRSLLAPEARLQAVRDSIFTAVQAPALEELKARVLRDTTQRGSGSSTLHWLRDRRLALGFGLAAAGAAIVVGALLLRFESSSLPRLAAVEGETRISRGGVEFPAKAGAELCAGDRLRLEDHAAATLRLADGSRLMLSGSAALRIVSDDGRKTTLEAGTLRADVRRQTEGRSIEIATPQAELRVIGTAFSVEAAMRRTRLEVSRGLVRMDHSGRPSAVEVAEGEFAVALPESELVAGVLPVAPKREGSADPGLFKRPFAADSPWNRPIAANAGYTDVLSEAMDFTGHGAAVAPASHARPIWLAAPGDPARRVLLRYEDRMVMTLRAPDIGDRLVNGTLVDPEAGVAYELVQAVRKGNDIDVMACLRQDLRGPGTQTGHTFSGLPLLAGIIRKGELAGGIPHALAAVALHEGLSRHGPGGQPFVPPARHMPIELQKIAMMGKTGNVCYGTRLAIPRDVDLAGLRLGSGALEIAKALQNFGAVVTHSYPGHPGGGQGSWKQPHLLFFADEPSNFGFQNLNAEVSALARLLKVVNP